MYEVLLYIYEKKMIKCFRHTKIVFVFFLIKWNEKLMINKTTQKVTMSSR